MVDNHTTQGVRADDDRGPWFTVSSGIRFHPLDPLPEDVTLEDISNSLSKLCRFNGHTSEFYSVAQHSVLMAILAEQRGYSEQIQVICLLHDATEAYVGDMVRPLKSILPDYRLIEDAIWCAIADRFDLPHQLPKIVKELDNVMCSTEGKCLMSSQEGWIDMPTPLTDLIEPLDPYDAYIQFTHHAAYLGLL